MIPRSEKRETGGKEASKDLQPQKTYDADDSGVVDVSNDVHDCLSEVV